MADPKVTTPKKTSKPPVLQTGAIPTPEDKIPEGFDRKNARALAIPFHNGKPYPPGTLVLISDDPLPEFNSARDVMVVDPFIAQQLDRQGVTGPLG